MRLSAKCQLVWRYEKTGEENGATQLLVDDLSQESGKKIEVIFKLIGKMLAFSTMVL